MGREWAKSDAALAQTHAEQARALAAKQTARDASVKGPRLAKRLATFESDQRGWAGHLGTSTPTLHQPLPLKDRLGDLTRSARGSAERGWLGAKQYAGNVQQGVSQVVDQTGSRLMNRAGQAGHYLQGKATSIRRGVEDIGRKAYRGVGLDLPGGVLNTASRGVRDATYATGRGLAAAGRGVRDATYATGRGLAATGRGIRDATYATGRGLAATGRGIATAGRGAADAARTGGQLLQRGWGAFNRANATMTGEVGRWGKGLMGAGRKILTRFKGAEGPLRTKLAALVAQHKLAAPRPARVLQARYA